MHYFQDCLYKRELSKINQLDGHSAVSPIVFTAVIGKPSQRFENMKFLEESEQVESRFWCAQTSQAWIDLQAIEQGDHFMSKWMYVSQLFDREYIGSLNQLFCKLISFLANNDWKTLPLFGFLPEEDKRLIEKANHCIHPHPLGTLFSRFEQVALNPTFSENIAVVDTAKNISISYQTLKKQYDLLAQWLMKEVIARPKPSAKLIAVLSEKGGNQVTACLSIMKAGFGYLPLHVEWPAQRIEEVLQQGEVDIVLISRLQYQKHSASKIFMQKYKILVIEDILAILEDLGVEQFHFQEPYPKIQPTDIAYVIFTSGSTGIPKGVTISHQGALNTIDAINARFDVSSTDKVLALSELSFDLSVYDIFGLLAVGGTIVFPNQEELKNPNHWLELISKNKISLWNTVPQFASLLLDTDEHGFSLNSLRLFLLSGDWIPVPLAKLLKKHFSAATVMSLGGATEASIWSIWYEIKNVEENWRSIPYGKAMPNQTMWVLNENLEYCPRNVIGEIFIGGMGVALNYWRDEKQTKDRFIFHPNLGRIYKTGDLGRLLPDGNIEFIGRNDFQVKIRGHRIELGEIEEVLIQFPGVKQGLVLVKSHGTSQNANHQYLVGYYVAESKLDEVELLKALESRLPEYMVPSALVHLEKLPITVNGKLDRKALPEPGFQASNEHQSPRNEVEKQCCKLWAEVLGLPVEAVGIRDDFFRLGGDSIISIQLVSRLRQRLGLSLSVKDIFNYKTIEKLYDHVLSKVQSGRQARIIQSEQGRLSGEFGLLPIQEWFFEQGFAKASHWNQSFLIKTPALERDKLAQSVLTLQEYHDAFRLRYRRDENGYLQNYASEAKKSPLKVLNLKALNLKEQEGSPVWKDKIEEILTEWQSGFDIEKGEVCSFGLIEGFEDGSSRIHIAAHHLIIDTISWRILLEDLRELYQGKHLDSKGSSYRQWVQALRRYSDEHPREVDYWQGWESSAAEKNSLEKMAKVVNEKPTEAYFELDEEDTVRLLRDGHRAYHTQVNDLLLTALGETLKTLTGEPSHWVTLEGHGREEIAADLDISRTMGWFTSLYPVKLTVEAAAGLGANIKQIKEGLRAIPNKGLG